MPTCNTYGCLKFLEDQQRQTQVVTNPILQGNFNKNIRTPVVGQTYKGAFCSSGQTVQQKLIVAIQPYTKLLLGKLPQIIGQ